MRRSDETSSLAKGFPRQLPVIAILIVTTILIFGTLAWQDRAGREKLAFDESEQVAFFVAESVRTTLEQQDRLLARLIGRTPDEERAPGMIARRVAQLPALIGTVNAASLLDPTGNVLARSSENTGTAAIATLEADAFAALAADPALPIYLTAAVYDAEGRTDLIGVARARQAPNGAFAGIVLIAMDASRFDILRSLPVLRDRSELAILRVDGQPLLRVPGSSAAHRPSSETRLITLEYPRAINGSFRVEDEDRRRGLIEVHYRKIRGMPLVVSYARPVYDLQLPWRDAWMVNAVLVSFAIAGFLVLGLILRRNRRREEAREAEHQLREAAALRENMDALAAAALKADEANRAKSRFFAHMTHELRTPLNAILGFSEVIRRELFGPVENARYHEYAGLIHDSGTHLLSLINDVLDTAKVEAGKMDIVPARISAAALSRSTLDIVRLLAEERGLGLRVDGAERCPDLMVDPRAIKQVLVNLLSNAIKFTPTGGSVEMRFQAHSASSVEIRVTDSGIGMEEDQIRTALEPFGQIRSDIAQRETGTGLGLPLARALVRLHNGELSLVSLPGKGTMISIILPAATAAEQPSPQTLPLFADDIGYPAVSRAA